MVLDFVAIDIFDFTRKIVKKKIWVKNSRNWNFVQKVDFSNSVWRGQKSGVVDSHAIKQTTMDEIL